MSYGWRERLQRAKKRLMEQMGLSQEDWVHIWDNIGDYCHESDKQAKLVFGSRSDIDKEIKQMEEYAFDEMCRDIIEQIMKKLGYIKVKERKKKQKKKKRKTREAQDGQSGKTVEDEVLQEEPAKSETVVVSNES